MKDLRDRVDAGIKFEELIEVVTYMAKCLRLPQVPELRINMFRHIRHGQWDANGKWISIPVHYTERSRAFAYYCIAHLLVHLKVPCNCRASGINAWRSAIHSAHFHWLEANLLRSYNILMVYRAENHQCEIQDLDGKHICDGLGQ